MPFTAEEQKTFDDMFWAVLDRTAKNNKEKLEHLADLLFDLTGNVNLRMWLFGLRLKNG